MITDILGLPANILRPADGTDCTLGGMSSLHTRVTVTGIVRNDFTTDIMWQALGHDSRVFAPGDDAPEAWLHLRHPFGPRKPIWSLVPACPARSGPALQTWLTRLAFGSNFAHLGDSRLAELTGFYGAVAVHDRDMNRETR